ncbi:F-box protein skip5 [Trebouxia sp. C0010 RCD-2024]
MKRDRAIAGKLFDNSNKKARTETLIGDLDAGCLLHVLQQLRPLPDLFSIAATCKRFKNLTTDSRLSVLVTLHKTQEQRRNIGRRVFSTLQDAVNASRAGDTIVLEAGQSHEACDVVIPWPLKLMGSGTAAEATVVLCPKGPDAALDFRSTGKVANLTIKATLSNCILHRRGKLTVEGCKLHCYASGLEHLFTPLVTLATSGLRVQREQLTRPMLTGREAGMGVLSVIETKIRGGHGATAVKCGGTGALQRVRVIRLSRDTLFWFDVHASKPGVLSTETAADSRMAQSAMSKQEAPWRAPKYSHIQGQAGKQEQASEHVDGASLDDDEQALLQRVKAWSTVHHPIVLNAGLLS